MLKNLRKCLKPQVLVLNICYLILKDFSFLRKSIKYDKKIDICYKNNILYRKVVTKKYPTKTEDLKEEFKDKLPNSVYIHSMDQEATVTFSKPVKILSLNVRKHDFLSYKNSVLGIHSFIYDEFCILHGISHFTYNFA